MSILKDDAPKVQSHDLDKNSNGYTSLDEIINKIRTASANKKKWLRIFLNKEEKNKFEKEEYYKKNQSQKGYEEKSESVGIGDFDTSDLIVRNYALYKKLMMIVKALEGKGLARELNKVGLLSTNDKVMDVLRRLEDKDISELSEMQVKEAILESDLDERANLNQDLDNNGRDDKIDNALKRKYLSSIDDIRKDYRFDVSCQGSVPQAIEAFLESSGFEDSIRTAISIGGDSDTIGAITGSLSEAYYGIPMEIQDKVVPYLDDGLKKVVDCFYSNKAIFNSKAKNM